MYESLNIDLLYVFTTVAELKSINKSSDVLILFLKEGSRAFLPEKHFLKLWFLGTSAFAGFYLLLCGINDI